jgi:hypothetical protein
VSSWRPRTEEDWARLQALTIKHAAELVAELSGASFEDAYRAAMLLHGGAAGRRLLEAFYGEPETEPERSR